MHPGSARFVYMLFRNSWFGGASAGHIDVYNGFLLTADWDAAFDAGLVSFDGNGAAIFSLTLSSEARARLGDGRLRPDRPLTNRHRQYLAWHATEVFLRQPLDHSPEGRRDNDRA